MAEEKALTANSLHAYVIVFLTFTHLGTSNPAPAPKLLVQTQCGLPRPQVRIPNGAQFANNTTNFSGGRLLSCDGAARLALSSMIWIL